MKVNLFVHLFKVAPPAVPPHSTFRPISSVKDEEFEAAAKVDEGFAGDDITDLEEFQNLDSNLLKDNVLKLKNEKYVLFIPSFSLYFIYLFIFFCVYIFPRL